MSPDTRMASWQHADMQDNLMIIGTYADIGLGPAVVFDGGGFLDATRLRAYIADLTAAADWLEGINGRPLTEHRRTARPRPAACAGGATMPDGDGLLTCRRCTIRYAWASDWLDLRAENERLRAAINRAYDAAQEFNRTPDVALVCVVETLEPHVDPSGDQDEEAAR